MPGPSRATIATVLEVAAADAAAGARDGRLTDRVVEALRAAGLFKLHLPPDLGGLGCTLPEACDVIAQVARADGSAGWAVMIGAGPNWFAGTMPAPLAAEVFGPDGNVVAGSGVPGTAVEVSGGLRVDGRWPWCSGAPWATWFTFNVAVGDRVRTIAVPAAQVRCDPASWDVRGLRATASWTAVLDGVFVPAQRVFDADASPTRTEAVFRVPFAAFAHATMAAVSVGMLEHALDGFRALAREKVPFGATAVLAADPVVQDRYAGATAAARAAARSLREATAALWDACRDRGPGPALCLDLELAARHAVATGQRIAGTLYELAGMSVLPTDSPLGRVLADLAAAGQNALVSGASRRGAGAALLDGPAP
ncbi:MAG: acyl-CoA dehydrogenase [Acidimicrobiia bacterium]|nr:MAG: acyl-CoA dehydrogenase [Acidimicrobiia bacterium]